MTATDARDRSPGSTDATGTTGVVQAVGRRASDIERRRSESLSIFAVAVVLYSVVGYWLVVEMHVVGFETLDRTLRASSVLYNDPPRLAAVGFDYPPLAVLLLIPFTVVPALTSSLVVVPVVSAVFAGATLVVVNTMMRRALIGLAARLSVLVALGLNPLVVLYASTGDDAFLWLAFVMAALGALFAWYVTADIRFVMLAGLAFAVASLTGYGSLVWFLVSLVMVAAILARLGADGTEIEGTAVGFASPTVYAVALWSGFNLLLLLEPLHWLAVGRDAGGVSFLDVLRGTVELVVHGAPIAIVVLPALAHAGLARHNDFARWLALMLLASILLPGVAVLVGQTDAPMVMSNALPILLVSVVGAIWLARSAVDATNLVAGTLAAGLLLSVPWTFDSMADFRYQGLERAFHDAVATGASQEGARTVDGAVIGFDHERDMADYIGDHVPDTRSILTDNAATYGVILMTGDPGLFLDRADLSDDDWDDAAEHPADHVRYLLLSTNPDDRLSRLYPDAAAGADDVLTPVTSNPRYTLVEVPGDYRYGAALPDSLDPDDDGVIDTDPNAAPDLDPAVPVDPADLGGVDGVIGEGEDRGDPATGGTP